ncbi:uncharacterized protein LOC125664923 [Ostrea edulis]|uniref:uncharacterized protein LOC125664923 n=1 Tax=Ostrea edulis TaxID=37623 RepID=UPI0024AFCC5B|nr:uncharacterized protein LOC125664923 [Ostrea edulis]
MNALVFGIAVLSIPVALPFLFGDECTISPQGFIPDGEHREYQAPGGCTNGTVDWNYPKEYIIVNFKRGSHDKFSVCIGESIGGDMFRLYDITGHTRNSISQGTWPCLNSHHGSVSIEIHAPEMQTYMGAIDYSIQI